jgi:hypothetical protein
VFILTFATWYRVEWLHPDPAFGWQQTEKNTLDEVRDFLRIKAEQGVNTWMIEQVEE